MSSFVRPRPEKQIVKTFYVLGTPDGSSFLRDMWSDTYEVKPTINIAYATWFTSAREARVAAMGKYSHYCSPDGGYNTIIEVRHLQTYDLVEGTPVFQEQP